APSVHGGALPSPGRSPRTTTRSLLDFHCSARGRSPHPTCAVLAWPCLAGPRKHGCNFCSRRTLRGAEPRPLTHTSSRSPSCREVSRNWYRTAACEVASPLNTRVGDDEDHGPLRDRKLPRGDVVRRQPGPG